MHRLSTNFTLILKLLIPLVYVVFFGSLMLGSWIVDINDAPLVGSKLFRYVFTVVFFFFVLLIYFTIFQLKRVDADSEYVYINNYKKTLRYTWDSIEKVKILNFGLFKIVKIIFKEKGSFGKKISFMPSNQLLKEYLIENKEAFALFEEE